MAKHRDMQGAVETHTFVVDGGYIREQARDAVRTYFWPLRGIYSAATGADDCQPVVQKKRA